MKKIIAYVISSQLFLFCTSEKKQSEVYDIHTIFNMQNVIDEKGNCNGYYLNQETAFGNYYYSGRGLDGKLEYKKGWDWMDKILYEFGDEENIRFNNQHWINEMDKFLFDQEFLLIKCELIRNYDKAQYNNIIKIRLNGLRRFMVKNSDYFDSEVLKYVNQKIDESMPK